jgi:hypothetical protein
MFAEAHASNTAAHVAVAMAVRPTSSGKKSRVCAAPTARRGSLGGAGPGAASAAAVEFAKTMKCGQSTPVKLRV